MDTDPPTPTPPHRKFAGWMVGAIVGSAVFLILLGIFWVHAEFFFKGQPGAFISFPPLIGFIVFSAYPIALPLARLADINFPPVLMIPIAAVVWATAGALIGALISKIPKTSTFDVDPFA